MASLDFENLSKWLPDPDLSAEEKSKIREQELEVLGMVYKKTLKSVNRKKIE